MTNLWDALPRHHAGMTDKTAHHVDGFRVTVYAGVFLFLCAFWYGVFQLVVWIGGLR